MSLLWEALVVGVAAAGTAINNEFSRPRQQPQYAETYDPDVGSSADTISNATPLPTTIALPPGELDPNRDAGISQEDVPGVHGPDINVPADSRDLDPNRINDPDRYRDFGETLQEILCQPHIFIPTPELEQPYFESGSPDEIHQGQQGKHIPGHPNFEPARGRSELTHPDPQSLLDEYSGTGQPIGRIPVGQPGSRERVDFGQTIGNYSDREAGTKAPTSKGIIHYGKNGAHIVPSRP